MKEKNTDISPVARSSRIHTQDIPDYSVEGTEVQNILSIMEKLLHWAAIIDSSDDAIISKSADGYITSWNRGAQRLYGYSPEEVIGKPVSMLMPTEKEDDFPSIMEQLRKGKKVDHYETRRKARDGRILDVSISVSPILDSTGRVIGASKIARDITERIEYERRRDDFVGATSHELKTPITSQTIFVELLEKQIIKNEHSDYLPFVAKIKKQTAKLGKLVEDLLDLSRVRAGQLQLRKEWFVLDELIQEQISDLGQTIPQKIVITSLSGKRIRADRDRLGQVILNLLSNASKYSGEDTSIEVSISSEQGDVIVSVRDFGVGISKKYHEKIFEQFFRVMGPDESTYPGLGIGLNFSREIVRRHGGAIWVESAPEKGSTFFFSLPIDDPATS